MKHSTPKHFNTMLGFLQEINDQNVILRMALMDLSSVWKGWEMQIFCCFFFSVHAALICTGCVLSFQCSNGTLTYIQSKCQEALSNLHTDPETGSHSLLALLPTTLQRCEEIHNEVGGHAGVSSHTCTNESVSKSFAASCICSCR